MKKWIYALMAVCAITFFLRSRWHELSGDELLYQYAWEADDPTNLWNPAHRYERPISSASDILCTQVLHYQKVNGRSLVHAAEQAFSGPRGFVAFCVVNTGMFLLLVWLVVAYASPRGRGRSSLLLWLLAVLALQYLFPYQESLWTSINLGINYLWPSVLSVAVLLLWRRMEQQPVSRILMAAAVPLGFVAGWSHEGFAVGMAGGTFIYWCLHARTLPRRLLWPAVPLWAGTAVLVLAPGNMLRFFGDGTTPGTPLYQHVLNGVGNMLELIVIWLFVAALAVDMVRHRRISAFLRSHSMLLMVAGVTLAFTLMANTHHYTHTFVELCCLLLLLGYMDTCGCFGAVSRPLRVACAAVVVLYTAHQALLCADTLRNARFQHRMVEAYKASPSALVRYDAPALHPFSEHFIRVLHSHRLNTGNLFGSMQLVYGSPDKPTRFLWADEYDAVVSGAVFTPANRLPGNAAAYTHPGFEYVWLHPDSAISGARYAFVPGPVGWHTDAPPLLRLAFALRPAAYTAPLPAKPDTFSISATSQAVALPLPLYFEVDSVKFMHF